MTKMESCEDWVRDVDFEFESKSSFGRKIDRIILDESIESSIGILEFIGELGRLNTASKHNRILEYLDLND